MFAYRKKMNESNPCCDSPVTPRAWAMSLHMILHDVYWINSKTLHTDIQDDLKADLTFTLGTSSCHIHIRFSPQSVYFSFNLEYLPTVYKNKEFRRKFRFSSSLETSWALATLGPIPCRRRVVGPGLYRFSLDLLMAFSSHCPWFPFIRLIPLGIKVIVLFKIYPTAPSPIPFARLFQKAGFLSTLCSPLSPSLPISVPRLFFSAPSFHKHSANVHVQDTAETWQGDEDKRRFMWHSLYFQVTKRDMKPVLASFTTSRYWVLTLH